MQRRPALITAAALTLATSGAVSGLFLTIGNAAGSSATEPQVVTEYVVTESAAQPVAPVTVPAAPVPTTTAPATTAGVGIVGTHVWSGDPLGTGRTASVTYTIGLDADARPTLVIDGVSVEGDLAAEGAFAAYPLQSPTVLDRGTDRTITQDILFWDSTNKATLRITVTKVGDIYTVDAGMVVEPPPRARYDDDDDDDRYEREDDEREEYDDD